MNRWRRFGPIALDYLPSVMQREWQMGFLALVGLAPGVAALTAWVHLAYVLPDTIATDVLHGWLLPPLLLNTIGARGVLVGAGLVTLLTGCLSLANVYLASIERRLGELALFAALGLRRREVTALLLIEAVLAGLLGSGTGVLLGLAVSRASWSSARLYFGLTDPYAVTPLALLVGAGGGLLAAVLFMGIVAATAVVAPSVTLRGDRLHLFDTWRELKTSLSGALFAGALTLVVALPVLQAAAALVLSSLALVLAALLTGSSWALTNLYRQLPTPATWPLWTLAVRGLARHPNHTAGMVLAMTAGAYGTGLAALSWVGRTVGSAFPLWVAGLILVAGAGLVLAIAALATRERRWEFGLLMALGARIGRVRRLVLLEFAIVALGGGALGALLALINWSGSGSRSGWWMALGIVVADLLAALLTAWMGAAPVLFMVTRRAIGQTLR